jgi:hypothetical protein
MTVSPAARLGSKFIQPFISELTIKVLPGTLLCLPAVMKSNFCDRDPSQGLRVIGMSSSRKSPAVGSIKRQRLVEERMVTFVKARVAVGSKGLAAAAAEGLRMPPARETEMTVLEAGTVVVAVSTALVVAGAIIVTVTVVEAQATCRSSTAPGRADMQLADSRTVKMSLIMMCLCNDGKRILNSRIKVICTRY